MTPEEIKKLINKLTKKQQDVLGWIAIGQDGGHYPRTLDALFKKGLILFEERKHVDRFGTFTYKVPYLPINVHMAWCKWCSENYKEGDEI